MQFGKGSSVNKISQILGLCKNEIVSQNSSDRGYMPCHIIGHVPMSLQKR